MPGAQVAAPRQYQSAVTIDPDLVGEIRLPLSLVDAEAGRGNSQIQITTRSGTSTFAGLQASIQSAQVADFTPVGDFFEYQFPFPVRIASRQSALLPFLQKTVPIERLSIFNAASDRGNPRLGARIDNNTDVPFESGPITFFQQNRYSGEAVLDYLPRGEKRLVSFSVDYDIQISRKQESKPAVATRLTVSKGVAVLQMESAITGTYEVRNKGVEKKTLIIEHPRSSDRHLRGIQAFETTDGFYRFRLTLNPGESSQLIVPEVQAAITQVDLDGIDREDLVKFAGKETPQAIRQKLGQIVDFHEQVEKMEDDVKTTEATITTLFNDQGRLRENLKALRDTSDDQQLRVRYLDQLKKQEDRIDASRAHIEDVKKNLTEVQTKLEESISNLAFGN